MRLIIVSNRLPVTASIDGDNITFKQSIGGLATGLNAFLRSFNEAGSEYLWLGWPGITVKANKEQEVSEQLNSYHCDPVFITESMMEKFNEGFCNKTLWPNFHYFTPYYSFEDEQWSTYKKVNELFCDKIASILQPNDIVWIQDYHLLLLSKLLRERHPKLTIGFFLHIPFPSYEIFQILPKKCRNELLQGMLGADLIGFHTQEYCQHFKQTVKRLLGYDHHMDYIKAEHRLIKVNTYPMGVDFNYIQNSAIKSEPAAHKQTFLGLDHQVKMMISIDRLDYTKGIPNRLLGYEKFLNDNPNWHESVVMVLLVAPSREGVSHYRKMKQHIDELAGRINGKFGTIKWMPIIYQYRTFTLEQLTALYAISDCALVTPLRDGMNLIAKEYICSKVDGHGVLILSETAGAAKELLDAIIINPNCTDEIAAAIKQALEMPENEQHSRISMMQSQLQRHDVTHWGNEIMKELQAINSKQTELTAKYSNPQAIIRSIKQITSGKKLLLLDYDGTLTPHANDPRSAKPDEHLLKLLSNIAANKDSQVVIVSGRDRDTLEQWLGQLNIDLVAEHGVWIRENQRWRLSKHLLLRNWEPHVIHIFEKFVNRLPGAFIERKEYSIAWHYRNADVVQGIQLAKELANHLLQLSANGDVRILLGNKVVEAMCSGIGKDIAAMQYLSRDDYSMILAMGDDVTDEDMFRVLPEKAFSVKIGVENTSAKFRVQHQSDAMAILTQLFSV